MSLQQRLTDLATAVGHDVRELLATRGTMSALTTTEKTNLVAALNEIRQLALGASEGGAIINDSGTGTDEAWSAAKIASEITGAIDNLVAGAPAALDTLRELADELAEQESAASALTTAVANRLRFDAAQTLTAPQKEQGNANLGSLSLVQAGDPETDLVAAYTAAKA